MKPNPVSRNGDQMIDGMLVFFSILIPVSLGAGYLLGNVVVVEI